MTQDPESVSIYDWAVTANLQPTPESRSTGSSGSLAIMCCPSMFTFSTTPWATTACTGLCPQSRKPAPSTSPSESRSTGTASPTWSASSRDCQAGTEGGRLAAARRPGRAASHRHRLRLPRHHLTDQGTGQGTYWRDATALAAMVDALNRDRSRPVEVLDGRAPAAPGGNRASPLHRLQRCRALPALLHRAPPASDLLPPVSTGRS